MSSPRPLPLRAAVERRSSVALAWLSLQPRLLLPAVVLGLLLAGALLPPAAGALCLLVVLLVAGWLSYLSWPVLTDRSRALRGAVLGMLAVLLLLTVF